LVEAMGGFLGPQIVHQRLVLGPNSGRARAKLYAAGAVVQESVTSGGESEIEISMPKVAFERFCRSEGLELDVGRPTVPKSPRPKSSRPGARRAARACVA